MKLLVWAGVNFWFHSGEVPLLVRTSFPHHVGVEQEGGKDGPQASTAARFSWC